jgi:D-alanine transaminase
MKLYLIHRRRENMNHLPIVYVNDQFMDTTHEQPPVSIQDRGYNFGDGVYEVVRIYQGKYYTLDEHIDRLYRSANEIRINIPFNKSEMIDILQSLLTKNQFQRDGIVYLQITRGASPRNHSFTPDMKPVMIAFIRELARPIEWIEKGVKALTVPDIRWLRCDIKSLNLLPNVLAKQEAADHGCYEAILHRNEMVTEGSSSNIFLVKEGKVYTHPANNFILNGITRTKVKEFCNELRIPFIEEPFSIAELEQGEVFLSSTTSEIMPIIEVDGKTVGSGVPGRITSMLQEAFEKDAGL